MLPFHIPSDQNILFSYLQLKRTICFEVHRYDIKIKTVADPGLRRGGANLLFGHFFSCKPHENQRKLDPKKGARPGAPLDPPTKG